MEGQTPVGEWDNYLKNFLKASDVTNEDQAFIIISMEENINLDGEKVIRLHLESEGKKYIFDLNKTNTVFLKGVCTSPKDAVGKKAYFKKVETRNPKTQLPVEGLRFTKIM